MRETDRTTFAYSFEIFNTQDKSMSIELNLIQLHLKRHSDSHWASQCIGQYSSLKPKSTAYRVHNMVLVGFELGYRVRDIQPKVHYILQGTG